MKNYDDYLGYSEKSFLQKEFIYSINSLDKEIWINPFVSNNGFQYYNNGQWSKQVLHFYLSKISILTLWKSKKWNKYKTEYDYYNVNDYSYDEIEKIEFSLINGLKKNDHIIKCVAKFKDSKSIEIIGKPYDGIDFDATVSKLANYIKTRNNSLELTINHHMLSESI